MSTVSRAPHARVRGLHGVLSDTAVRIEALLVLALTHAATIIGDLDERWGTPAVLRISITILSGLLLGSILAATTTSPVAPPRRIVRLVAVIYAVWWSTLVIKIGRAHV